MKNENWNLGHSLNKGYPYNGIESKRMLKDRPTLTLNEGRKVIIEVDAGRFPDAKLSNCKDLKDFLLHRLFDFQEALAIAEGQLFDILEEKPFIPENYGFKLIHKNKDITEPPVRVYKSIYNDSLTLFRKPAQDENSDPSLWTLMEKIDETSWKETELLLPCDRIAYAALSSLRVTISSPEGNEGNSGPVKEEKPVSGGRKKFKVKFTRFPDLDIPSKLTRDVEIEADNESDALSRAKFHLETNPDESFEDVKPEELSAVEL